MRKIISKICKLMTLWCKNHIKAIKIHKKCHFNNGNKWCYNTVEQNKGNNIIGGTYMYSALDIAKYVIYKCVALEAHPISNLQLQKTLYYIQGYYFKIFGIEAYKEDICSWPYGPVVPDVYFEYNMYGNKKIENFCSEKDPDVLSIINNYENKKWIDKVVDECIKITPSSLVQKTHDEQPWKSTVRTQTISKNVIRDYFMEHDPLNIVVEA